MYKPLKNKIMFKKLFKSKKEKEATKNTKVEKLNTKELNNVVGGAFTSYISIKGTKQGSITNHP